ncbi:serine hydrolase domain-containing protein [Streptomyces huiliensis]|uniref:serine hydrolase domain-containing protein n=1 Tax=Streptomyces huiliensis TaxID=2876027 RepID=UPI001CBD4E7F|nr:serine hydrolase domain-containing protein [Streptomyces huiliensis]MBZ4322891.1 beta-lactamase family protein [Streptomyces huiliensis]
MSIGRARRALLAAAAAVTVAATAATSAVAAPTAPTAPAGPAAPASDGHAPHRATQAALEAQVQAGVPGVLAEARDANGRWTGSAGVADLRTYRERLPQDRFRIGSISKVFSSVVLLQLEAEGKVDLDDTLEHRLPGVVRGNGNDGGRITIRQVLNHTSGLFNYTEDEKFQKELSTDFFKHRYDTREPADLLRTALSHRPDFRPGTDWHYSNTNYVVAGMLIEKLTGHSYADEIRHRVVKPLGLRATTLPGTSPGIPGPHGRGYSKLSDDPAAKIHDTTEQNPSWAWAAGEIISTTGDLNRFYNALLGGRLLPERQQRELLTTVPSKGEPGETGYGLGISKAVTSCGTPVWLHSGGIQGSTSLAVSSPDGRHTAAFNLNGDWTGDLAALVDAEYCGIVPADGKAGDRTLRRLTALR